MTMTATVLSVNPQSLLVRNEANGEEVLVFFRDTSRFSVGDRIRIFYTGQTTLSIPPQITAITIQTLGQTGVIPFPPIITIPPFPWLPAPPPTTTEMRAVVVQTGTNYLIVQNMQTGQQYRVDYAQAHHFCPRQQIIVKYDTITMSNPPRVTATDITPVC